MEGISDAIKCFVCLQLLSDCATLYYYLGMLDYRQLIEQRSNHTLT